MGMDGTGWNFLNKKSAMHLTGKIVPSLAGMIPKILAYNHIFRIIGCRSIALTLTWSPTSMGG